MTELIPLELVKAMFPDIEWKPGYRLSKSLQAERVAIGSDGSGDLLVPFVYESSIGYERVREGEAGEDGYRYFKSHDDLLAYCSEFCHEAMKSLMKEKAPPCEGASGLERDLFSPTSCRCHYNLDL